MINPLKNRRQFIKLASSSLALPLILPAARTFAQNKPPLRLLTLIDTYGIPTQTRNQTWIRSETQDYPLQSQDLGSILQPLEAYIDNMLVISRNRNSSGPVNAGPNHHQLATHTLTGSGPLQETRAEQTSIAVRHASIDVHIGKYLNNEYGLDQQRVHEHLFFTDYAERAKTTFCFDTSGKQIRSIAGAKTIRDTLFGATASENIDLSTITNKNQRDVLALIDQRIKLLAGNLGNANEDEVLAAYAASVQSVSREIDFTSSGACPVPAELLGSSISNAVFNKTNPQSNEHIFNNIYHAFACNLAGSITYAFGGETINQLCYANLYNSEEHNDDNLLRQLTKNFHASSHLSSEVGNKVHELVRQDQSRQLAHLLDRLSTTIDTDGSTMLDNTVVFFTSQMSDNTHHVDQYPLLMIAGKNTQLQGGFHYACTNNTNNEVLTTLAQGLGMSDEEFGGHNAAGNFVSAQNGGAISKMLKG